MTMPPLLMTKRLRKRLSTAFLLRVLLSLLPYNRFCHLVTQTVTSYSYHMVFLHSRHLVKFIESISKWRLEVSNQFLSIGYSFGEYGSTMVTFQRPPQIILGIALIVDLCLPCSPKPTFTLATLVLYIGLCKYIFSNIYFIGNTMRWRGFMSAYIFVYIWMNIYICPCTYM